MECDNFKRERITLMQNFFTKFNFTWLVLLLAALASFNQQAQAQVANSGFETGTLAGWSATSGVSISSGYTAGNWTVNPSGSKMARLEPTANLFKGTAEANLGLAPGALSAFNGGVFNSATNFGTLTQTITLNAGQTFTMYWNYLSQDYAPFNDGILASLTGPGYQKIQLLAVTANAYGSPNTIVTGDYGSTGWHAVTFTAGAAGTYKLGFSDFNYLDQALNPIQANDNAPGGTSAPGQPVVTTAPVTSTSPTTAASGGNVTSDGGSAVSARGVCWATTTAPTTASAHTIDGTGTGAFISNLTGLTPGTTYYVRAYATNITGTNYGPLVTLAGDTQAPVITTNGNQVVSTDANACSATVVVSATATDNVSAVTPTGVRSDALALTAAYPKGITTITWSATDAAGNASTASQTVTVSDTVLPTITAPAAVTVSTDAGQCSATGVALGMATAADNCAVTVTNNAPAPFAKGVTTVTWTATDASGNVATATQTVTVTDDEKPVLTVPAAIVVTAPATVCGAVVAFNPTATDNCAVASVVASPASGSTFPVGTSTVTVTATDASGNTSTSSFAVTVKDLTAPAVMTRTVTVTLVNGAASVTTSQVDNGSTDACGIASFSLDRSTFSCANLGNNPVVLTVTDVHGNVASAPAVVTVVGAIPTPSIAVIPASSVYTGGVATNLYLGYGAQSATLAANGGVSYSWSPAAGLSNAQTAAPVFTATTAGTFTYTVTATNQYGCTATATVTLRVVDVRCGNKNDKVIVCHNGHEICISPNAVDSHLSGHPGDQLGACGSSPVARTANAPVVADATQTPLLEAYPNPFGASTTVHFRPVVTAPARVRVYDVVGRVVAVLFDGTAEVGHDYSLTLSAEQLATGLYLCRYESQGKVYTQRLSVAKQ